MELLAAFQILIANSCGMIFIENPSRNFIIENHIVSPNFPFNEYQLKDNCSEMINYPRIFKSGNNIIFVKEPNKEYPVCYFNLSPDECKIIDDN
ncbi:hypothetical protein [Anabaena sp. UHCC 0451]|uniref:hypothetical protein n=1 Tax=Anabaena sp. UHCC 0451 TaxID=2055235 RepID=UPI002B1F2820|nr:hypothetical protein [Anabaena sp. UHCC 0451]MEA5578727.1 hypothetical protein [Anabaena sp. UHCC 0451]